MALHLRTGKLGEKIAASFLKKRQYKIIETNFRNKWGEIDIIAIDPNEVLVFVEVKTAHQNSYLKPEEELTFSKFKKLSKICQVYANNRQDLIKESKGWRIDLITLTIEDKKCLIKHYKNIFL